MAWSYDNTDLGKHLNWIRLVIGDTDSADPLLDDNEINGILALEPERELAAALACEALAAKFAARGGVKETETFQMRAAQIRASVGASYL